MISGISVIRFRLGICVLGSPEIWPYYRQFELNAEKIWGRRRRIELMLVYDLSLDSFKYKTYTSGHDKPSKPLLIQESEFE